MTKWSQSYRNGGAHCGRPLYSKKRTFYNMKKVFGFIIIAFAVALTTASCRHEIKHDKTTGIVDEINDSAMVLRTTDNGKVKFDITVASFTHGAVMYGDSVIVHYAGDLSMKRALAETVFLIDRPGTIVEVKKGEVDETKELKTRPAEKDALNDLDNVIKYTNRQKAKGK